MQTEDMDDWRWWRQVLVRGSGFPAHGVLRLANEGLARKADTLADADRGSEEWRAFREEFGHDRLLRAFWVGQAGRLRADAVRTRGAEPPQQ